VCIIKTTSVEIILMNEVDEDFAKSEGEGDLSYSYWYEQHKTYFTKALEGTGIGFKEDILLVCERFELIDVKK